VAFGLLMQVTDIMLMVAALADSGSRVVGWGVHLTISLLFAVVYAVLLDRWIHTMWPAAVVGALYGWIWWLAGGLIIMPASIGRDDLIFRFTATAWQSLAGHLLYGVLLGVVYAAVRSRVDWRTQPGHGSADPASPARTAGESLPAKRRSAAAVLATARGIALARNPGRR
jgi:uncharacterized membrane protein YagU involved in acid resistance